MSTLIYADGAYNRASGTRDAFGALSDQLVAEGYPAITVVSGDREFADQERIFLARYRAQASGVGPFNDVRWYNGVRYVRVSGEGTVAVPRTSTHESRRSDDLGYPYNTTLTRAHARAVQLAPRYGIECDGLKFGEAWHFTNRGSLGTIAAAASSGATPFDSEENEMNERQAKQLDDIENMLIGNGQNTKAQTGGLIDVVKNIENALLGDGQRFQAQEGGLVWRVRQIFSRVNWATRPPKADGTPGDPYLIAVQGDVDILLAAIGGIRAGSGTVDVADLAERIRTELGEDLADALASRLARPKG